MDGDSVANGRDAAGEIRQALVHVILWEWIRLLTMHFALVANIDITNNSIISCLKEGLKLETEILISHSLVTRAIVADVWTWTVAFSCALGALQNIIVVEPLLKTFRTVQELAWPPSSTNTLRCKAFRDALQMVNGTFPFIPK